MRRGDKLAALIFGLAILAPFLIVVVFGNGEPHAATGLGSEALLGWLAFTVVAMLIFYAVTVAESGGEDNSH